MNTQRYESARVCGFGRMVSFFARLRTGRHGVQRLTRAGVRGFGCQKGHTELYRGAEYKVDFFPKIQRPTSRP
jgi:hypothetical protein